MLVEPAKASFICLEDGARSITSVQFNPSNLTIKRSVKWTPNTAQRAQWSGMVFAHGNNDTLSMTLLLDESEALVAGGVNALSVLTQAMRFHALTTVIQVPPNETRPPVVAFTWEQLRFQGVVQEVEIQFVLFSETGQPKRALVTLSMTGQAFQTSSTAEAILNPPSLPLPPPPATPPTTYSGT